MFLILCVLLFTLCSLLFWFEILVFDATKLFSDMDLKARAHSTPQLLLKEVFGVRQKLILQSGWIILHHC